MKIEKGIFSLNEGFRVIQPFKFTQNYFSHFVDLSSQNYFSGLFPPAPIGGTFYPNLGTGTPPHFNFYIPRISSCGSSADIYIYHYDQLSSEIGGMAGLNNRVAIVGKNQGIDTIFHEIGHSFVGLADEYVSLTGIAKRFGFPFGIVGKNCLTFIGERGYYSGYQDAYKGCTSYDYIRPSWGSIMNTDPRGDNRFNVISCAYILQRILNTPKSGFKVLLDKCMDPSWNTIKPGMECNPESGRNMNVCASIKGWYPNCVKGCDALGKCILHGKDHVCYVEGSSEFYYCDDRGQCCGKEGNCV